MVYCTLSSSPPRPSRPQGTEPIERGTKGNAVSAPGRRSSPGPSRRKGSGGAGFLQEPVSSRNRALAGTVAPSLLRLRPARWTRGMPKKATEWDATRAPLRHPGPTAQGPGLVTQEPGQTRRTFGIPENSTLESVGQRRPLTARRKPYLGPTLRQGEL